MKVWMLCEAFTLTGDAFGHQTVHKSLTPWSLPCESRKAAMRELEKRVKEHVVENYEGHSGFDERIESDVRDVMASGMRLRRGEWRYGYSAGDREIVWLIYTCEVLQ